MNGRGGGDQMGGGRGERSGCFQLRLESDSSSEVISLIHSGRCANILPKISWQRTQAALMLEVFTLCGPGSPTNTHTNTNAHAGVYSQSMSRLPFVGAIWLLRPDQWPVVAGG